MLFASNFNSSYTCLKLMVDTLHAIHCTHDVLSLQEVLEEEGRKFAAELVEVTQTLLTQFNDLVAADEVLPPSKIRNACVFNYLPVHVYLCLVYYGLKHQC